MRPTAARVLPTRPPSEPGAQPSLSLLLQTVTSTEGRGRWAERDAQAHLHGSFSRDRRSSWGSVIYSHQELGVRGKLSRSGLRASTAPHSPPHSVTCEPVSTLAGASAKPLPTAPQVQGPENAGEDRRGPSWAWGLRGFAHLERAQSFHWFL